MWLHLVWTVHQPKSSELLLPVPLMDSETPLQIDPCCIPPFLAFSAFQSIYAESETAHSRSIHQLVWLQCDS